MNGSDLNLDALSYRALKDLQKRVNAAIVKRAETEKRALRENMKTMVEEAGFSLDEIFGQTPSAASEKSKPSDRQATEAAYVHPENGGLTWAGRGPTPKWLKELEKQGRSREEFAAKKPNSP